jgi:aminoglycoside phosphotransferase family enzyme
MDDFEVHGTAIAVAALTIVQRLMLRLADKGLLSQADLEAMADECIAFHEATGDEPFIRSSEQTALLLRQLFQR